MTLSLMLQGTGSDVGKSVLVAGLCRALVRRGMSVRPFKPQNMSNNAAVADDGGEIGRAQALQAIACGVEPTVHMNPVLLKPQSDIGAQIVVHGKVIGTGDTSYFREKKTELLSKVIESFNILKDQADIVIVEGAGSPAEVNLRANDIANMGFAEATNTPVVLIGDIDRGGVIASIIGTYELLSNTEKKLTKGYIINKFRGDVSLFDDALVIMTDRTNWTNIGVLPFIPAVKRLPAEDAVVLDHSEQEQSNNLIIAVPMLSRIANFDDLDPLILEPDVDVRFVKPGDPLPCEAGLVIIPGTKSTLSDLKFFKKQGWDIDLNAHVRRGGKILGICGGYQMLGLAVSDANGIEGVEGNHKG
ncbi:MAG: cobyric acid synthase, partial [Emcibacteraceae bacterium]|nr:cobyric acid synthase [Emcibacteraceae bacterium]